MFGLSKKEKMLKEISFAHEDVEKNLTIVYDCVTAALIGFCSEVSFTKLTKKGETQIKDLSVRIGREVANELIKIRLETHDSLDKDIKNIIK